MHKTYAYSDKNQHMAGKWSGGHHFGKELQAADRSLLGEAEQIFFKISRQADQTLVDEHGLKGIWVQMLDWIGLKIYDRMHEIWWDGMGVQMGEGGLNLIEFCYIKYAKTQ